MRASPHRSLLAGVHVGGTKILAGIFGPGLEPLGCAKVNTRADRGCDAVLDQAVRALQEALAAAETDVRSLAAAGVGIPGCVNPEAGLVTLAVNLKWTDVPARQHLEQALGVPVIVDNDANVSLLGIHEQELRRVPGVVMGVFIGSGIGGALLINGKLFHGQRYSAAEVGHMIVNTSGPRCACGRRGCFEALSSRTAVFRELRAAVIEGESTLLTRMLGEDLSGLRSGHLRKALRQGDKVVRAVLHRAAEHAGIALSNLLLLADPGIVVLGGGLMEAVGMEMLPVIQRMCGEMLPKGSAAPPEIIVSALGDSAGILGGAIRARDWLAERESVRLQRRAAAVKSGKVRQKPTD